MVFVPFVRATSTWLVTLGILLLTALAVTETFHLRSCKKDMIGTASLQHAHRSMQMENGEYQDNANKLIHHGLSVMHPWKSSIPMLVKNKHSHLDSVPKYGVYTSTQEWRI